MADKYNLTAKESNKLEELREHFWNTEMDQLTELFLNCKNKYQLAKTHSNYIKDFEKIKEESTVLIESGNTPDDLSVNFYKAYLEMYENIINEKCEKLRNRFYTLFGEDIYNYLDKSGKSKKIFGIFG